MRIAIVGLGLIGGSMALALHGRHSVRGHDSDPATREAARAKGLDVADRIEDAAETDAVIVATPLAAIVPTIERLLALAGNAVVLETGSVKADVAALADRAPTQARIVGLHPMAGSTASGFASADPALFRDRPVLVVPTARSDADAMALAGDVARELGGVPTVLSAHAHDRAVAMLSGIPLAAALALARTAADVAHLGGPGFRDATRLAQTGPDLARAILQSNRAQVKDALARFRADLDEVERSI